MSEEIFRAQEAARRAFALPALAMMILGAAFAQSASAASFADSCAAGTGGMFEAKDCPCLDAKIADAGDKQTLMAYFDLNAEMARTGNAPSSPEASDAATKGVQLIGKYLPQCMK
jgi:hypothetical protein